MAPLARLRRTTSVDFSRSLTDQALAARPFAERPARRTPAAPRPPRPALSPAWRRSLAPTPELGATRSSAGIHGLPVFSSM